jgi:hypothetical protein
MFCHLAFNNIPLATHLFRSPNVQMSITNLQLIFVYINTHNSLIIFILWFQSSIIDHHIIFCENMFMSTWAYG